MRIGMGYLGLGYAADTTGVPAEFLTGVPFQVNSTAPLSAAASPNAESCLAYQCGAGEMDEASLLACAQAGYSGVKSCGDPACAPYCPNRVVAPLITAPPLQVTPATPQAAPAVLTPQSIVQPMPDITRTLQPVVIIEQQSCDWWQSLNGAINGNPGVATLVLAVTAFVLWRKH